LHCVNECPHKDRCTRMCVCVCVSLIWLDLLPVTVSTVTAEL